MRKTASSGLRRLADYVCTEQVLRLFSLTERHILLRDGLVRAFRSPLTDLQRQVLTVLGVPHQAFA